MPEKPTTGPGGITRRNFLTTMGAGAIGATVSEDVLAAGKEAAQPQVMPAGRTAEIALRVNGQTHGLSVETRWTLLHVLREVIGLTAAKPGCERGECGACTVLIDGIPRYACLTLAVEAQGREITTLEGLMDGEALGTVQVAFAEADAFQCGKRNVVSKSTGQEGATGRIDDIHKYVSDHNSAQTGQLMVS
jgi:xanthine dehydrogenase YagT iron-sulfur-binding subunit